MLLLEDINRVIDHIQIGLMHVNVEGWTWGRAQGRRPHLLLISSWFSFTRKTHIVCNSCPPSFWSPNQFHNYHFLTPYWHSSEIWSGEIWSMFSRVFVEQIKHCYFTFLKCCGVPVFAGIRHYKNINVHKQRDTYSSDFTCWGLLGPATIAWFVISHCWYYAGKLC